MYQLREIKEPDNIAVARVIRAVMTEFGAVGPGTSILDPEVDDMAKHFSKKGHLFFVLTDPASKVVGVGGIAPLKNAKETICELQKMYLLPEARGKGLGKKMLEKSINAAKELGYQTIYLETLASMEKANALYKGFGFEKLETTLGCTGHSACDTFYALRLN